MHIQTALHKFINYSLYERGLSPTTIRGYKTHLGYFIKETRVKSVSELNENMVREFLIFGRSEKNWKVNTYRAYHKVLIPFIRWCRKENLLPEEDFMKNIEVPKLQVSLPKGLKKEEALRLLEVVHNYPYKYTYLRHRNHAIFSMFIHAGLRKSELLKLCMRDVDVDNLTIFVRRGKGGKDRIIPMSYPLSESLKAYLSERKRLKKTCPEFFVSLNRNIGFTESGIRNLKGRIQEASNIKFTLHGLRHTFATLMLEGGCDIYSLSKMMGHAQITTTTIYLSASAGHLRSQILKHPLG